MMAGRTVGDAAEVTLEAPCYSQSGGFTLSGPSAGAAAHHDFLRQG